MNLTLNRLRQEDCKFKAWTIEENQKLNRRGLANRNEIISALTASRFACENRVFHL